jgi:hypothetical protein
MSDFPSIFRVRQTLQRPLVQNIAGEVDKQLAQLDLGSKISPGQTVAISVGSRGIANIALIIKATVEHLKSIDAAPFIVPAMGSHGGGTAAGQQDIIEGYGVTEKFCGCPIRATMDTVTVCDAAEGFPVYFDRHAYEADHVLVCGRVKPHTGFVGDIESGLMKMMLIGLGKHDGAKIYHRAIQNYSFGQIVRSVGREVLARCNVVAGLAIIENGYDETAKLAAVAPREFESREKELLLLAKQWMPSLPFNVADILMIDEIGKNISGTGMDTNIVGRKYNDHKAADDEFPKVKRIAVRGLTEASHGNATGLGISEFCLNRVVEQRDAKITAINCITGGHPEAAMVPIHFETDRALLASALPTIGLTDPPDARMMWIRDTLSLAEVECSSAYLDEARQRDDLEVVIEPRPIPFQSDGMLPAMMELGAG